LRRIPDHELANVSVGQQDQNRALANELQRVHFTQRYFILNSGASALKADKKLSEQRFFLK